MPWASGVDSRRAKPAEPGGEGAGGVEVVDGDAVVLRVVGVAPGGGVVAGAGYAVSLRVEELDKDGSPSYVKCASFPGPLIALKVPRRASAHVVLHEVVSVLFAVPSKAKFMSGARQIRGRFVVYAEVGLSNHVAIGIVGCM